MNTTLRLTTLPVRQALTHQASTRFSSSSFPEKPYEDLPPADTIRLLNAVMYTDYSEYRPYTNTPKPKYMTQINTGRWIELYQGMLNKILANLNPKITANAYYFFSDLQIPLNTMEQLLRKDSSAEYLSRQYEKMRNKAVDNLEKLDALIPILAISKPDIAAAALEDTITRQATQSKATPWYLK